MPCSAIHILSDRSDKTGIGYLPDVKRGLDDFHWNEFRVTYLNPDSKDHEVDTAMKTITRFDIAPELFANDENG